jgi:hypothetical protein
VAVDPRWVSEALRQSYPWLRLDDAGGVTPVTKSPPKASHNAGPVAHISAQDYLEKIFQVAFWLEPMSAPRAASYLASLVRSSSASGSTAAGDSLEISAQELDYMRALAAYVGPSPRRVKRLVNAYRMIKARLPDAQREAFVTDHTRGGGFRSGPYQIVLCLLTIGTGARSFGPQIMAYLTQMDPTEAMVRVVERLRAHREADFMMAAQVIETLMRTQEAQNVSELRGWARRVERYFLHRVSNDFNSA